jgi:hypothetical protein
MTRTLPVLFILLASCNHSKIPVAMLEEKRIVIPVDGILYPSARKVKVPITAIPRNVNMIGSFDVVGQSSFEGKKVGYCTPGKQVPQNEVAGEVNPQNPLNLVAGANDYRLINQLDPSDFRYDGSGGYYRTVNGGKTWTVGLLPGMVRWNQKAPGKYTSTSDPTIAASIRNTFWYCNLVFNRDLSATAIGISRSTNGGLNWKTTIANEIANPPVNSLLINDKPWLAADPNNPNIAHITWTLYRQIKPENPIAYMKTTDGGKTFSKPKLLTGINYNQGSQIVVDGSGNAHVVWYSAPSSGDSIAYRKIANDGKLSSLRYLAKARHVASPVPWAEFYTNSFPSLAIDGEMLHVVWANWNGKDADIVYIRSTNGGATWTKPVTIAGGSNYQFLPSVGANRGLVAVGFSDHKEGTGPSYHISAVTSADAGATWSQSITLSSKSSEVNLGNRFNNPECGATFIGDYNDTTVDRQGKAHFFWTDVRVGNSPGDPESTADQDPYVASMQIPR